jgi:hypothetical protein
MHIYAAISPAGSIIGGVRTRSFSRFDANLSADSAFVIENLNFLLRNFHNPGSLIKALSTFPEPMQRPISKSRDNFVCLV